MESKIILKKVKRDYTKIAKDFNGTRQRSWPEFEVLWNYLKKHSSGKIKVLDVGCGNGRLYTFLKDKKIHYIGIDNNRELLSFAKKNHPKARFMYGDVTKLPRSLKTFDSVWCIAVLHHLPTPELQLKALQEMKRVLKKEGLLMLTVWNLWQPKYKKYINKETNDALIPWSNSGVERFYHAFTQKELETLLKKAAFSKIKKVPSKRNFVYICHR